jgi:enoyl-[acyl-carrier protein] reductase I
MSGDVNLLSGKRGLVMGLANDMSIAWGIAKTLQKSGAEIALSYQGEILKKRVMPLADELESKLVIECDVKSDQSVADLAKAIELQWGSLDFIVHSIAYADKEELKGRYIDTSRENFLNSLDVSCYSFLSVVKHLEHLLSENSSVLTLTYLGSERVVPNYNVMGVAKAALEASVRYMASDLGAKKVRVNSISAGPIRTLAASGISDFRKMYMFNESMAPLKRNVSIWDVGNSALYLLSHLSAGVTGAVHYVDCGANIMNVSLDSISS